MKRNKVFLQHLYKEKEIHKEHRNKHVIYKLLLTGSFFGLGQFSKSSGVNSLFLYVVPFIAMIHDIYIAAEHFKVQRVGLFLKNFDGMRNSPICNEEILWEKYLERHRETWAYKASIFYTALITAFSAIAIYFSDTKKINELYWVWVSICAVFLIIIIARVKLMNFKIHGMNQADPELIEDIKKLNKKN